MGKTLPNFLFSFLHLSINTKNNAKENEEGSSESVDPQINFTVTMENPVSATM